LFVKGLNVANALTAIEQEAPSSKEKEEILNFIRESKDGIMKGMS
jgi:UDP-N-acetylglucosamine acyltransferase